MIENLYAMHKDIQYQNYEKLDNLFRLRNHSVICNSHNIRIYISIYKHLL